MSLTHFRQPPRIVARQRNRAVPGPYPEALARLFPRAMTDAAVAEIRQWQGYAPTPLYQLDRLAGALGLDAVIYKDEGVRFGLGSFKALGGAYAVLRLLADRLDTDIAQLRNGRERERAQAITVTTATDGNHGRSVAWGAQRAGCRCRIYVPAHLSEGRAEAMAALGAEIVRVAGDYDHAVHHCARESAEHGWEVVSDTSYEGYIDTPRQVMAGYAIIAAEVLAQLSAPITHIFVQAGVGGLAAGLAARLWMELGEQRPRIVVVESEHAACLLRSARRGAPTTFRIRRETMMAGMSCGEASLVAWAILSRAASDFVTISDGGVAPAMRMMASGEAGGGEIAAGECAVAGVVALIGACCDGAQREALGLDASSRVLVIGSEGVTDPDIYRDILAGG